MSAGKHSVLPQQCVVVCDDPGDDDGSEQEESLTFDECLTKYVGEFGRGQVLAYVTCSLLWVPNAVLILLLVFSLSSPVTDKAWDCTSPDTDAACMALLHNTPDAAAVAAGFCELSPTQWRWTDPGVKLTSRFNLVCGDAWRAQVANSLFFVGYFIGSGVFGILSDRIGRKPSAFGASLLAAVFAAGASAAPTYYALLALRLLTGIGVAGQALGAYLLATEMIGPAWRGFLGIITQVFFIVGEFALVIIGVALPSWRGQFAAGAVLCAASLLLWFVVPESGRWLQAQGRTEEAQQSLAALARLNGTRPPPVPLAAHAPEAPAQPAASAAAAYAVGIESGSTEEGQALPTAPAGRSKQGLGAALRDVHIARRFVILAYAWLVMCMAYYGISFALGALGGSLVVSFSIAALAELPSYLLAAWLIGRVGRHNTMGAAMLLGGVACVGCALTPAGPRQTVLAALGKFAVAGAFAIASIYTSELFPTLIRSAVLGVSNQAARLGGIIAPFIIAAGARSGGGSANLVPFMTFGVTAVLAGLLIFTLPETLGVPLPETMQDMDAIASVFTHKTWRTRGLKAATHSMFRTHVVAAKRPAPAPLLPVVSEAGGVTLPATLGPSAALNRVPSVAPPGYEAVMLCERVSGSSNGSSSKSGSAGPKSSASAAGRAPGMSL